MPKLRPGLQRDGGALIVVSEPLFGDLEEQLVLKVLRSGRLVQGPMVETFEEAVRQTVGVRHAMAVNNGTSALMLCSPTGTR